VARYGKATAAKRERERALAAKRMNKLARRTEAKNDRPISKDGTASVDPDIADIVPGPQPLLWWQTKEE
jgi:hypothetical protein